MTDWWKQKPTSFFCSMPHCPCQKGKVIFMPIQCNMELPPPSQHINHNTQSCCQPIHVPTAYASGHYMLPPIATPCPNQHEACHNSVAHSPCNGTQPADTLPCPQCVWNVEGTVRVVPMACKREGWLWHHHGMAWWGQCGPHKTNGWMAYRWGQASNGLVDEWQAKKCGMREGTAGMGMRDRWDDDHANKGASHVMAMQGVGLTIHMWCRVKL